LKHLKKHPALCKAEEVLRTCREVLNARDGSVDMTTALAKLDTTVVRVLLDKPAGTAASATVESAGRTFIQDSIILTYTYKNTSGCRCIAHGGYVCSVDHSSSASDRYNAYVILIDRRIILSGPDHFVQWHYTIAHWCKSWVSFRATAEHESEVFPNGRARTAKLR
jgi:hypothetical protein